MCTKQMDTIIMTFTLDRDRWALLDPGEWGDGDIQPIRAL